MVVLNLSLPNTSIAINDSLFLLKHQNDKGHAKKSIFRCCRVIDPFWGSAIQLFLWRGMESNQVSSQLKTRKCRRIFCVFFTNKFCYISKFQFYVVSMRELLNFSFRATRLIFRLRLCFLTYISYKEIVLKKITESSLFICEHDKCNYFFHFLQKNCINTNTYVNPENY